MGNEWTMIKVKKATREALFALGGKGDSYDDIIQRLLKESEEKR
jgi:hypothetical protein